MILAGADLTALTSAFAFAWLLTGTGPLFGLHAELLALLASVLVWFVLAPGHGLYGRDDSRLDRPATEDLAGIGSAMTFGGWSAIAVAVLLDGRPRVGTWLYYWAFATVFVVIARSAIRHACRRTPALRQRALIVGTADFVQLIARKLIRHDEYGIDVIGFVDDRPTARRSDLPEELAILGGRHQLAEIVERFDVDRVLISVSSFSPDELQSLLKDLHGLDVHVDLGSGAFELLGPRAAPHLVEGFTLLGLPPARHAYVDKIVKRAIDVIVSGSGLVLGAPMLVFIALRIRLDSPGPTLFRQTRLGRDMKEFSMLKFRTMHVGTDTSLHREYIRRLMSEESQGGAGEVFKLDRPDAVTRAGKWLRKSSLDELPQLFNVLRGDMSLVGPRPCIPYEVEFFEDYQFERFRVPQGITGFWQVVARASSTYREALDMDVAYVRGWSLALDLRLLIRTPLALIRQRAWTA